MLPGRPARLTVVMAVMAIAASVADAEEHALQKLSQAPIGLSSSITDSINTSGIRVAGPDGPVCDIWLVKQLEVKSGFKPTLSVKYPFAQGQLIGAMQVPDGSEFTDFRGQEISSGIYTLRYGQQPEDGNHIGTSELADFLLALPASDDQMAEAVSDTDDLSERSAEAAGTSHPAIFSLLPAEESAAEAALSHDDDNEFWILSLPAAGKDGDKDVKVPMRVIVIGEGEI